MTSKKTIPVETLKDMVNDFLFNSPDDQKDARETLIMFFENVCKKTNNQTIHKYLNEINMLYSKEGTSVGILENAQPENQFNGTDHTRVQFQKE